jgi:hypothetical protein
VIPSAAKLRSVVAATAAFAWLSAASPAPARAQDKPPATPPAPAAAAPAPAKGSKAAKTSKPKSPKTAKPKTAKPPKPPEPPMDERRKVDGVYAKGSNWLQLRFGYAKRTGDLSGDGFVGYGMAYQRMLSKKYAFAAGVDHDVVGHFAHQIDESVPFTGEFRRVFKWAGEMRPYLGVGGGYYFRKMYRTDGDYNTTVTGGGHVSFGLTSQLDDKHVIGFETRVAWLQGRKGIVNPTFGPGEDVETIWTAKLTWALAY